MSQLAGESLFGVYLLYCLNPQYKGRTYIGYTRDLNQRLEKYFKKTCSEDAYRINDIKLDHWKMVLLVHGFPNNITALRFEWTWQNSEKTVQLQNISKSDSEPEFQFKMRILAEMLRIHPWNSLPLHVRWMEEEFYEDISANKFASNIICDFPEKGSYSFIEHCHKRMKTQSMHVDYSETHFDETTSNNVISPLLVSNCEKEELRSCSDASASIGDCKELINDYSHDKSDCDAIKNTGEDKKMSRKQWKRHKLKMKKKKATASDLNIQLERAKMAKDNLECGQLTNIQRTDLDLNSSHLIHSVNYPTKGPRHSAKKQRDLAVRIFRKDGVPVDLALAEAIRSKLIYYIESAVEAGTPGQTLAFANSGLVLDGYFLVTPLTEVARNWLLSLDFRALYGIPLLVTSKDQVKVMVWLPGKPELIPSEPLNLLRGQNCYKEELRLQEWSFLYKETLSSGTRLMLKVPRGIIQEECGYVWLNFQATQVQARLIKQAKSK